LFAHAAAGYQFADRGGPPVGVDLTMSGATAARAPFQRVNEDHLETLVGATYDFTNGAQLFGGAGVGLRKGYGTPDWRTLMGVRIGFGGSSAPPLRPRPSELPAVVADCPASSPAEQLQCPAPPPAPECPAQPPPPPPASPAPPPAPGRVTFNTCS